MLYQANHGIKVGSLISDPEEKDSQERVLDAAKRKLIEERAMEVAEDFYRSLGFRVEDTHKSHPYDLKAVSDSAVIRVEVKGTTG